MPAEDISKMGSVSVSYFFLPRLKRLQNLTNILHCNVSVLLVLKDEFRILVHYLKGQSPVSVPLTGKNAFSNF